MEGHAKKGISFGGFQCSNFGVWGDRTLNGELYTGRNLDWLKGTGISDYKLITINHPADGHAHASFGFAGLWGSITGLSDHGLSVHEANLESNDISFSGFPWLLRLRHIMAYSEDLQTAMALWKESNNTVGFNHGVGSAADNKMILMETMAHNTAYFSDMDPRESSSPIGKPRSNAVYRTNHGYDPYTIAHYMWNNTAALDDSISRYNLFPVVIDAYENSQTKVSALQAINITAVVGEKGQEKQFDCTGPFPNGWNILSATFHPKDLTAYVAWETGSGDDEWVPAACNDYIAVDLKQFFV